MLLWGRISLAKGKLQIQMEISSFEGFIPSDICEKVVTNYIFPLIKTNSQIPNGGTNETKDQK